jgi:hypothetical protein
MENPGYTIAAAAGAAGLADAARLMRGYAEGPGVDLGYQDFEGELASLSGAHAQPRGALLLARGAAGAALGCGALRPSARRARPR